MDLTVLTGSASTIMIFLEDPPSLSLAKGEVDFFDDISSDLSELFDLSDPFISSGFFASSTGLISSDNLIC